jgi:hypothetical protein
MNTFPAGLCDFAGFCKQIDRLGDREIKTENSIEHSIRPLIKQDRAREEDSRG